MSSYKTYKIRVVSLEIHAQNYYTKVKEYQTINAFSAKC